MLVVVDPCSPLMLIRKNNKTATESLCTLCEHCTRIVSFFYPVLKHGSCLLVSKYPPKYYVAVGLHTVGRKVWNFIHSPPDNCSFIIAAPHEQPFSIRDRKWNEDAISHHWGGKMKPQSCAGSMFLWPSSHTRRHFRGEGWWWWRCRCSTGSLVMMVRFPTLALKSSSTADQKLSFYDLTFTARLN